MNKKYQVFVSSTYKDLKEERMAVIRLLLKMGFIPVGMEQFPASNMSQMEYIKMMLDSCDYYLLILAGKYGSVDVDGIGFTEKEYDYAIANGIPVMSILVEDIGKLENAKCEDTDAKRELLMKFREKVSAGQLSILVSSCFRQKDGFVEKPLMAQQALKHKLRSICKSIPHQQLISKLFSQMKQLRSMAVMQVPTL